MNAIVSREIIRKDLLVDDVDYENLCLSINQHKRFFLSKGMEKGDVVCLNLPADGISYIASYIACLELGLPLFIWDNFLWDITNDEYMHDGADDFVKRSDRVIDNITNWTTKFNTNRHFIQHTIFDEDINYELFPYWRKAFEALGKTGFTSSYEGVENMPTDNIQPWTVYGRDIAIVVNFDLDSDEPKFRDITHQELLSGLKDFPKDEVFGFSTSLHHRDILQKGILPALMNSKRLVYLLTPSPKLYGDRVKVLVRRTTRKMKRYGVNAMYTDGPDSMRNLFELMGDDDFLETVRIMTPEKRGDFHEYWESEKNILFQDIG